ncbi:MAG: serine protease [Muribaculaceae bacterium]|nr:serine protease [Muribaculaceae bacterium]
MSEYWTPTYHDLKWVCPRIDCLYDNGMWEKSGSGVLFGFDDEYYVVIAAHCIKSDSADNIDGHFPPDKIKIKFFTPYESSFDVGDVPQFYSDEEVDFALLKVKFIPFSGTEFDYKRKIKLVGSDQLKSDQHVGCMGYDQSYEEGHHFRARCCGNLQYELDKSYTAESKDPYCLKGSSGGGLFIAKEDVFYCLGYVKKINNTNNRVDSIEIRRIPQLNYPGVWMDNIESDSESNNLNTEPTNADQIKTSGCNQAQQDYYDAWRNLAKFLQDNSEDEKKYANLLDEIDRTKLSYPRSMSAELQNSAERLLFYKHSNYPGKEGQKNDVNWSENDKRAFAYVMRDKGAWPNLYGRLHESLDDLKKQGYAKHILQRGTTISGNSEIEYEVPDTSTDEGIYEMILRAAFSLDFPEMKKLTDEWTPSDNWLPHKVMLDSLWYNLTEESDNGKAENPLAKDLEKLKDAIDSGHYEVENKFIACIVYNVCKAGITPSYSYYDFWSAGINSPEKVMAYMAKKIDKVKIDPVPYGTHVSHLFGNIDNDSFPESLRLVNYLMNSGLLTASKYTILVNIEIWMKVFKRLFPNFPGMTVFYTLAYGNEKLSTLAGQEIAFVEDEEFASKRAGILLSILKAIESDMTPPKFYRGLYLMASEILPVVDETIWFKYFYSAVEKTLSAIDVGYLTVGDPITQFIGNGILNLKNTQFKKGLLSLLMNYFNLNSLVISYILSWAMSFDKGFVEGSEVSAVLQCIIDNYPIAKTYRLLQRINYDNCLSEENREKIESKIKEEGLAFAKSDSEILVFLSYLIKDNDNLNALKEVTLSSWEGNFWNCGIKGQSFSSRGHLHLEELDDKIEYTDQELRSIIDNMEANVRIIKETSPTNIFNSHISHLTADLLVDMKKFLAKPSVKPRVEYDRLNQEIDGLIFSIFNTPSNIDLLSSGDFNKVREGVRLLNELITKDTILKFQTEIQALIFNGISKNKESLELSVDFLRYLVETFPEEMKSQFGGLLNQMLRSCSDIDYQVLHVHALNLRKNLDAISLKLKEPDNPQIS